MTVSRLAGHPLPTKACQCGYDSDWWSCLDGATYGPYEDENCGGVCEYKGDCPCACHKAEAEKATAGR